MASTCRKSKDSVIWHLCSNCSKWPLLNYEERHYPPYDSEICKECEARRGGGTCR